MTDERQVLLLMAALSIGLLIGIERGWHGMQEEKPHAPGVRTYGLIGLLGGATGLIVRELGQPLYGFVFMALAGVLVTAYLVGQREDAHAGITSLVAALLTFALGTLATLGYMVAAAAAAIVSALLLGFKPLLHHGVASIEEKELHAALKLLLITVVLLPVLPDRGFGPGQALNPYEIWWMVVLVASISFSGYFAVKAVGPDKGVALTSVLAGLASSTALTLNFARLGRRRGADANLLSAAILLATATLYPRVLVIASVVNPRLAWELAAPMGVMTLAVLLPGLLVWRLRERTADSEAMRLNNPLELGAALRFGALLAVVMLLVEQLGQAFGGAGVLVLGVLSGVADLNAITLSVGQMSRDALGLSLAVSAIVLASTSNGLFKSVLSWAVGGFGLGLRVTLAQLASGIAGLIAVWATGNWPQL